MFPFNDHFDEDALFNMAQYADIHQRSDKPYIPGDIYISTSRIAAELIVMSIYQKEATSYSIKRLSKNYNHDTNIGGRAYDDILGQLSTGEDKSLFINRTLSKYNTLKGQGELLWAYFFYAISHERCLGRFGLTWLQLVPNLDTATMPVSCDYKGVLQKSVNEMVEVIYSKHGKDNSLMNRVDAALLSIELELGLGIRRVDAYQTA